MSKSLDFHTILTAAEIIRQNGQPDKDGGYRYQGVSFIPSIDGYSVSLRNKEVLLTVNFHNTYHIDAPSRAAQEQFFKSLRTIVHEN